jgi:FtsZ-binding cell division protein ZapB
MARWIDLGMWKGEGWDRIREFVRKQAGLPSEPPEVSRLMEQLAFERARANGYRKAVEGLQMSIEALIDENDRLWQENEDSKRRCEELESEDRSRS